MTANNVETLVQFVSFMRDAGVLGVVILVARALYQGDLIGRTSAKWFIREVVLEVIHELEAKERRVNHGGRVGWRGDAGSGGDSSKHGVT